VVRPDIDRGAGGLADRATTLPHNGTGGHIHRGGVAPTLLSEDLIKVQGDDSRGPSDRGSASRCNPARHIKGRTTSSLLSDLLKVDRKSQVSIPTERDADEKNRLFHEAAFWAADLGAKALTTTIVALSGSAGYSQNGGLRTI